MFSTCDSDVNLSEIVIEPLDGVLTQELDKIAENNLNTSESQAQIIQTIFDECFYEDKNADIVDDNN